jgi:hypothetical protein
MMLLRPSGRRLSSVSRLILDLGRQGETKARRPTASHSAVKDLHETVALGK